jgi:PAS domain S-box-containing protein
MPSHQKPSDAEPGHEAAEHRREPLVEHAEAASEPLRANETYLRLALEGSAAGTWSWDVTTDQVTWDERWEATYGVSADEPPSQDLWLARIHPVDRARVVARLEEMRRPWGEDRWEMEFRVVLPDGRTIWIEDRGRGERDATGRLLRVAGINLDITRRKSAEAALKALTNYLEQKVAARTADLEAEIAQRLEAEAALRASEERLRTIYQHAPVGIIYGSGSATAARALSRPGQVGQQPGQDRPTGPAGR